MGKFLSSSASSSRGGDSLLTFLAAYYWVVSDGFGKWRWRGFGIGCDRVFMVRGSGWFGFLL